MLQAREKGRMGTSQIAHYDLDRLGVQAPLHLPTADSSAVKGGSIDQMQTLQDNMPDMPDDVKQRLASLLAAEFSKKVRVYDCVSPLHWCHLSPCHANQHGIAVQQ